MQSSRLKIGKIKEFNGYSGEIVSLEGVYYFTRRDIVDGMTLQNNDVVIFNGKTEEKFPQAYFIKKANLKIKKSNSN